MDKYLSNKIKFISFISIIMVVYVHAYDLVDRFLEPGTIISDTGNFTSFFQYFISNGLTRVSVPFFFAISGYLFFINLRPKFMGFIKKMRTRVRSVLIPYLLWCLLGSLFLYLTQLVPYLIDCFDGGILSTYGIIDYIYSIIISPIPFQLWFLNDLIKYIIISPIIYLLVRKLSFLPIIPLFLMWFFEFSPLQYISIEGILFFTLGAFLGVKKIHIKREHNKIIIGIVALLWLGLLGYKTYSAYNPVSIVLYISTSEYVISAIMLFHKISIILGIITVWVGYDIVIGELSEEDKLLKFAPYTFFIFAGHVPLLNILINVLLKTLPNNYVVKLLVYILIPVVVISLLILLAKLLTKYLNPVYNILTGGRDKKVCIEEVKI